MIRTYKRKLILRKGQRQRLASWIGTCRYIYNIALEIKIASYKAFGRSTGKFDLMKQLTGLKDIEWIKDVPSQSLQAVIERLDRSFQNFFRTYKQGGGFPRFRSKNTYRSILFKSVHVEGRYVILPKIGRLKMNIDRGISGIPKTATITIEPTGFFVNIQCEEVPARFLSESQAVGLDMGLSHFCIDSDGHFIENPQHFKRYERQLRVENRALARKKRGSKRWQKQCRRLARLHHKIFNVRNDFLHKESTKIARRNSMVFVEDLHVKGMSKNPRLAKYILDAGWGKFRRMLEYKTTVISVDPKYTSQKCSVCGTVDGNNRISQSEYVCTACGHAENADVNAAKNILSRGTALNRQREATACA